MNRLILPLAIGVTFASAPLSISADPTPLRDDIQVRRVVDLDDNTFRIAKDPRDDILYVQVNNGTISRVRIPGPDELIVDKIGR